MCLKIYKKTKRNEVKRNYLNTHKPNAKGFIVGYKLFRKSDITDELYTPYEANSVIRGLNKSDRITKKLTKIEKSMQEINHGCHFFLTLEDANLDKVFVSNSIIRKIYFKPKDLVAIGRYSNWCDSGVVMQYKLY